MHVACLNPAPFRLIASRKKNTEFRFRRKIDARLESVEAGDSLLFLLRRSTLAIRATVRHALRFDYEDGHLYAIRFRDVEQIEDARRRTQGWVRHPADELNGAKQEAAE